MRCQKWATNKVVDNFCYWISIWTQLLICFHYLFCCRLSYKTKKYTNNMISCKHIYKLTTFENVYTDLFRRNIFLVTRKYLSNKVNNIKLFFSDFCYKFIADCLDKEPYQSVGVPLKVVSFIIFVLKVIIIGKTFRRHSEFSWYFYLKNFYLCIL